MFMPHRSELSEPQKLLTYILQPEISLLSPETIAVYIQAATKIFGFWATEVAERWTDEDLPEVKGIVDLIVSRVTELVTSPHIEVQERVSRSLTFKRFEY
jgi:AP-3 complex subunit delta-1